VGHRAAHNLIHNVPHEAIGFRGNDHLIEFNEIHSVCYESNDAGAIYAGREWTMRGTVIRHNYLHHISGFQGRGDVGVYLDDTFCGTTIYGNIFYRVTQSTGICGGQDNTIENNVLVECSPAVYVDARGMGWAKVYTVEGGEHRMYEKLRAVNFQNPPYSVRYPKLATILEGNPLVPEGNIIARNVCWGSRWDEIEAVARPYLIIEDNLVDEDPHFVDAEGLNFHLRDDSPAYALGFKRIPIEEIGLYQDELRASYPVQHTVRKSPPPPGLREDDFAGQQADVNAPTHTHLAAVVSGSCSR